MGSFSCTTRIETSMRLGFQFFLRRRSHRAEGTNTTQSRWTPAPSPETVQFKNTKPNQLVSLRVRRDVPTIPLGSLCAHSPTIPLVSLCVHRDAPTILRGSLCAHTDAPSIKTTTKIPLQLGSPSNMCTPTLHTFISASRQLTHPPLCDTTG